MTAGQMSGAEGFKVRRLIGQNEIDLRPALADEFHQEAVSRDAACQHHLAARYLRLGKKLGDLVRHHLAQGQRDVSLTHFPLVQTMGAVRLHENRAPGRYTMRPGADAEIIDVLDPQVHAAELLTEEFAGP